MELENIDLAVQKVSFDANTNTFINSLAGVSGSAASEELIHGLLDTGGTRRSGAVATGGRRTLARGAVLRALLREASGSSAVGGERNDLLARVARLGNDAPEAVNALFSRDDGEYAPTEVIRIDTDASAQRRVGELISVARHDQPQPCVPSMNSKRLLRLHALAGSVVAVISLDAHAQGTWKLDTRDATGPIAQVALPD